MLSFRRFVGLKVVAVLAAYTAGGCGGEAPLERQTQKLTNDDVVNVAVDWTARAGGVVTRLNWGLNAFAGFDPGIAGTPGNATYKANVAAMAPGLLRYHNMGMMGSSAAGGAGWVVSPTLATYAWDRDRIARALAGAYEFPTTRMINIANWPAFLDDGAGKLRTDAIDAYAAFCADLVRLVNVELGYSVKYWEVTNEKDPTYATDIPTLASIYNRAAAAMRLVDPTIKVGGPAFLNPYRSPLVKAFVIAAADQLDFFSYHSYTTGDSQSSNVGVLDSAAGLGWVTAAVITPILQTWVDHPVETYHNEWNISWNPPDERMTNEVSAVYDALAMISLANGGVTGSAAWNEADGRQGKLADTWGGWAARPAAYVYQLFNQYLGGEIITTSTSASSAVVPFATRGSLGAALVLVNREADVSRKTKLTVGGLLQPLAPEALIDVYQVTAAGLTKLSVTAAELLSETGWTLPPYSVTVVPADSWQLASLPPVVPPVPPQPNTTIPKALVPPVIDGIADDAWAASPSLPVAQTISGAAGTPEDLTAHARLLWTDTALYVLVDVVDETLLKDSVNTWEDDGVEIFIDADNSKAKGYGRNDHQYAIRWNGGLSEGKHDATTGVQMAQVNTDGGYRIELSLPWQTLRGTPSVGALVGIDLHVNDDDEGGGRDSKRAWFGSLDNAWQTPSAFGNAVLGDLVGGGLLGEYFSDTRLSTKVASRVDPQIDFRWAKGSPDVQVPENRFGVRWTGFLTAPVTGDYAFVATSDDGVRVWLDGQLLIDSWRDRSAATTTAQASLVAGKPLALRVEYYENWGDAAMSLGWSRPDGTSEVIPNTSLSPATSVLP